MAEAKSVSEPAVSVYWQPGCTSCLRAKEYLTRHNVPFRSRNVLADDDAYAELERFGIKRVPIVSKGMPRSMASR